MRQLKHQLFLFLAARVHLYAIPIFQYTGQHLPWLLIEYWFWLEERQSIEIVQFCIYNLYDQYNINNYNNNIIVHTKDPLLSII